MAEVAGSLHVPNPVRSSAYKPTSRSAQLSSSIRALFIVVTVLPNAGKAFFVNHAAEHQGYVSAAATHPMPLRVEMRIVERSGGRMRPSRHLMFPSQLFLRAEVQPI